MRYGAKFEESGFDVEDVGKKRMFSDLMSLCNQPPVWKMLIVRRRAVARLRRYVTLG